MFDLIMFEKDGKRSMFAAYLGEDGREWRSATHPAKGAFGPIAEEFMRDFPGEFESVEDIRLMLLAIHFRNMGGGKNRAGQDYPMKIGTS